MRQRMIDCSWSRDSELSCSSRKGVQSTLSGRTCAIPPAQPGEIVDQKTRTVEGHTHTKITLAHGFAPLFHEIACTLALQAISLLEHGTTMADRAKLNTMVHLWLCQHYQPDDEVG